MAPADCFRVATLNSVLSRLPAIRENLDLLEAHLLAYQQDPALVDSLAQARGHGVRVSVEMVLLLRELEDLLTLHGE